MTNRAHERREPQKGKKGFSKQKGFTVIELLIAVAVLAIITSIALPSYRTIIEKRQVTSGAEQLAAFLSSVQIEAVKRSENISVTYSYTDSENWCIGMITGTAPCDCTDAEPDTADCKIDGQIQIINQDGINHPKAVADMTGDGGFMFDPARGLVYDESGSADYDLAGIEFENDSYALDVVINQTGRVKLCSSSSDKIVPGYDEC